MPKFYREAIIAAHRLTAPEQGTQIGSLETWSEVAQALNSLPPAARCHAIYADWLLQLHEPGGDVQIQIRDLLLGQGALAANYLGEMAQNADDSGATSLPVALDGNWLLVANNGRPLSSLNLLGLCRFFVHSNGQVVGLTPETIGRFGIGFKSCHRVADEVFVWSGTPREGYGFRLPICQSGGDAATPAPETLARLRNQLDKAGKPLPNLRPSQELGHCTPEIIDYPREVLPQALVNRLEQFQTQHGEEGVWFALNLHQRGREEAETRIMEQADALYELCPLFLKHLRTVTLQDRTLRMTLGGPIGQNTGSTEARRVTLEVTNSDGIRRNDRLLLLSSNEDQKWNMALPADSEFKIKRPAADQFSLRSGGGYAFLPLPSLIWPWHLHFHLNAPTNLARSDWNPADAANTHAHVRDASAELAAWVSNNAALWHSTWQPADILTRDPFAIAPDSSARVFADSYQNSLQATESLRTLWGTFTSPTVAVGLRLEPGTRVTDAWAAIAESVPANVQQQYPLVLLQGGAVHLDLDVLTTEKAEKIFTELRNSIHDSALWRFYVRAVLGTDPYASGGFSRSEMIEDALTLVPLDRPSNAAITIATASTSRFSVRLTDEWHEFFRDMSANWLGPNWTLASQTVFGVPVSHMLKSLSTAAATPTGWDEVSKMTESDFRKAGDAFWSAARPACPPALQDSVIRAIWVESGPSWVPLTEVWLGGEPIAMMKGIVRPLERKQGELNDQRRKRMFEAIDRWGLNPDYDNIIEERVEENSESEFYRRLKGDHPANPHRLRMLVLAPNWNPSRLPAAWRDHVTVAVKQAVNRLFEDSGCSTWRGKTLLVGGGAMSKIMSWLPNYVEAPVWFEPDSIRWVEDQGILRHLNLSHKDLENLTKDRKSDLGKELLAGFRHWIQPPFEDDHIAAMRELLLDATGTWTVGYPGGADKRLNEHCAWIQPITPECTDACVDCIISGAIRHDLDGGSFLPVSLAAIPELRNKCIQVSDLHHEPITTDEDDDAIRLIEAEIPDSVAHNPWFHRLRELLPDAAIVSLPGQQRLKWKRGSIELTVPKADFGLCKLKESDAIFIADAHRSGETTRDPGARYLPVLVAYTQIAPNDRVIGKAVLSNRRLGNLYKEHRDKIKARLVQVHATEMGYHAEHVMRELLQNAESAYASRKDTLLPEERQFKISAKAAANGADWEFEISHSGRAFNETDSDGNERADDIWRLSALAGTQNRTDEEVGRFNRGFKAVFQVTDEVRIISGGYIFSVEDMLILDPIEPVHDSKATDTSTRFIFRVGAAKKTSLLRDDRHGKPKPFAVIDLVFLRHIDTIITELEDRIESRFELRREVSEADWRILLIRDTKEPYQMEKFLVCQRRDTTNQRTAVAIMLDANGLPVQVPKHQRFLYRTFPLEESSDWFPFLMNADFITDKGRAGLLPKAENDALIIHALEMSLALVRSRITETSGCIPNWVSWVNSLGRSKLKEGASTVSTRQSVFDSALHSFDTWLFDHLPDGERLRPASEFTFPSRLMREVEKDGRFSDVLRIDTTRWINCEVAEALQPFGAIYGRTLQLRGRAIFIL